MEDEIRQDGDGWWEGDVSIVNRIRKCHLLSRYLGECLPGARLQLRPEACAAKRSGLVPALTEQSIRCRNR